MSDPLSKIITSILLTLLLIISSWLFMSSQVDPLSHQQRIEQITDIQRKTDRLIQNILLVESGELHNFDSIAELEQQIESALPKFETGSLPSKAFSNEAHQILSTVTQIKSTYAIYHNSLLYFPKGISLLKAKLSAANQSSFSEKLTTLERGALLFSLSHTGGEAKEKLSRQIATLLKARTGLPKALHLSTEQLLKHTSALVTHSHQLQSLNSQLLNNRLSNLAQELVIGTNKSIQKEIHRAAVVQRWFFFTIFILTLSVAIVLRKQHQTLHSLNSNVELLHLANKSAQQGSFEVNFQTGSMLSSEDYAEMLGYAASEFSSSFESYLKEIHPDNQEEVMSQFKLAMETGEPLKVEYRRKTKDGHWLWIYSTGEIVEWDDNQKPLKMAGIHANITERKKSEQLLLNSQNLLQSALRAANLGHYVTTAAEGSWVNDDLFNEVFGIDANFSRNFSAWHELIYPADRELVRSYFDNSIKENNQFPSIEYRIVRPSDGALRWVKVWGYNLFDKTECISKQVGLVQDITASKQQKRLDHGRNIVLEKIIASTSFTSTLTSIVQLIEEEDPTALCSILILDDSGEKLLNGAAPNLPAFYNEAIHGVTIGDGVGSCGTAAFKKERVIVSDIQTHPFWALYKELAREAGLASCWSEPIFGAGNKLLGTFAIYHSSPQTPSKESLVLIELAAQLAALAIGHHQSKKGLELSAKVFNDTHEGITITEPDGTIIEVNPAFCEITGYSREEAIGQNPRILSSGKQGPQYYVEMWQALEETGHWQGEIWNRKKNGNLCAELLTISALKDDQGKTLNYVGIFSDITHSKEQQKELELMAHYDVLTKLPNRALFYDRFIQAVAHSKRTESLLAVCFLDLDNFKPVNDNYGHNVGDLLLIEVAARIKKNIREEDTVSRQGGDEFTLLLGQVDHIPQYEAMLKRILNALAQPYTIEGHPISISASLGATIYPLDNGDIDTLTRHADQAMYQSKLAGKNRYHFFNAEQDQQVSLKHQRLEEIQHALLNDEFCLYYQPKVNMRTGKVYGAEALIRWQHPDKGLIPPLDFLPVIEETALEIQIGEWVIQQALAQISHWNKQGISLEISVNIASYHLQSNSFISQLEEALSKQPEVNPNNLQLEVLESSTLGDTDVINAVIRSCQEALGVKVALDDFGTGYSSLTHLRNLPAETIKIDQTFVRDMLDDPDDYTIIDGIIGLSNSFDREVIAEGVETTEHGLMLILMGCDHAQGYGIARPMPADELSKWLNHYTANEVWINCGNSALTPKERRIQQLDLALKQWEKLFESAIQSPFDKLQNWPIMDQTKCSCGSWLRREKHDPLFDPTWLAELDQVHEQIHSVAKNLKTLYLEKELDAAREGLPQFKKAFSKMYDLLARAK